MTVTEPLREEHRELLPHVEDIGKVADAVGVLPVGQLRERVDATHDFLANHLLVHAAAEEAALYPEVGRILGDPRATATMSRDHLEVERLTDQLEGVRERLVRDGLTDEVARDLRCILYGLYTVVGLHFAKEEEIYLPILDASLSPAEGEQLFVALGEAARDARRH